MQDEIIKIELVLENCEVITIKGKHIGDFVCEDIKYSIQRLACNSINEVYSCETFYMSIHRDCSLNKESNWTVGNLPEEREPLKRILEYPDITCIYIYFKDKKNPQKIYPKWSEGDEYSNKYQKTYMNKFGDLYIVIDKNLNLEDVFDKQEIEDEHEVEFSWRMFS